MVKRLILAAGLVWPAAPKAVSARPDIAFGGNPSAAQTCGAALLAEVKARRRQLTACDRAYEMTSLVCYCCAPLASKRLSCEAARAKQREDADAAVDRALKATNEACGEL